MPHEESSETSKGDRITAKLNLGVIGFEYTRSLDRKRIDRGEVFTQDVITTASASADSFQSAITSESNFSDIYAEGLEAAVRNADQEVRRGLADLIACALLDEARVDTIQFLFSRLRNLDPLHLRILFRFPKTNTSDIRTYISKSQYKFEQEYYFEADKYRSRVIERLKVIAEDLASPYGFVLPETLGGLCAIDEDVLPIVMESLIEAKLAIQKLHNIEIVTKDGNPSEFSLADTGYSLTPLAIQIRTLAKAASDN